VIPLRYAVVKEGVEPKTIVTKLHRIPVTIPPGQGNVAFSHIEDDLTFRRRGSASSRPISSMSASTRYPNSRSGRRPASPNRAAKPTAQFVHISRPHRDERA